MELNEKQRIFIDAKLNSLKKSTFRSSFKLKDKDREYIDSKGMDVIRDHAEDFVRSRLSGKVLLNDGKQTPMRGHPVFVSQHATATCCRGCLYKWHKIEKDKELNEKEIRFIVALVMEWIRREYEK